MRGLMLWNPFDWMGEFFKSLLAFFPKLIYLLYSSLACLLDVFQLLFRKLAGLDVYFDANGEAIGGDIVTNFISGILGINFDGTDRGFNYSILSTVFWSFVVFGVIVAFISVFVMLIKSHYNYDDKAAKGPMQYVYAGLKALVNIAVVPIIVVLGLYVSQAVLTAVDSITAGSTSTSISDFNKADLQPINTAQDSAENSTGQESTYIYYDFFGAGCYIIYGTQEISKWPSWDKRELALIGSNTQTFSGALFKAAAYNANRARTGQIQVGDSTIYGLEKNGVFSNPKESKLRTQQQALADMIDTAFSCNLHLSDEYLGVAEHQEVLYEEDGAGQWTSTQFFTTWITKSIPSFSKFNIGAVWYYYDLWNFNFIIGFGGVIICVSLFINVILGMMTRIFMCLGLFLVAPPLFGLAPLDGGKASKSWTENFMKQVLMVYGAVIGMNIFFIIFPLLNQIKFFNIPPVDTILTTILIIVGLLSIKAFIAVVSGLVGGEDANKTGDSMKEEIGKTTGKATKLAIGAAIMPHTLARKGLAAKNQFQAWRAGRGAERSARAAEDAERRNQARNDLMSSVVNGEMTNAQFTAAAASLGMSAAQATAMWNAADNAESLEAAQAAYATSGTDTAYETNRNAARQARRDQQVYAATQRRRVAKQKTHLKWAKAGGFGSGMFTFMKDSMLDDKGLKGFTETIWKPRDYAKETADNTAAINSQMATMNSGIGDINKGVGSLGSNQAIGNRTANRTRRDMNQGFADQLNETHQLHYTVNEGFKTTHKDLGDVKRRQSATTRAVTLARHAVEKVKQDTADIKNTTAGMATDLNAVKTELNGAKTDRQEALRKQEEIRKEAEAIRKKAEDIERKI